jgi:hypothetical protein
MNKQIFEEYLLSLETIAANIQEEEFNIVMKTVEMLPDKYKEKVMECINIAIEAGKESNYG